MKCSCYVDRDIILLLSSEIVGSIFLYDSQMYWRSGETYIFANYLFVWVGVYTLSSYVLRADVSYLDLIVFIAEVCLD